MSATDEMHVAHVVSLDPLLITVGDPTMRKLHLMPTEFIGSVCFLRQVWWSMEAEADDGMILRQHAEHLRRRPQDRFILLCNTPEETATAARLGLEATLAHHNAFIDERIFRPLAHQPTQFDAVYNAAFLPWKRHELAAEIRSLAFVGYFHGRPFDSRDPYYRRLQREIPEAVFCNVSGEHDGRYLTAEEVNALLNRCKVGLCLSAIEGGNYASIEYMLSGLPVVSTPSVGGRDRLFDPDYCIVAPADPRSIREATEALVARNIPRSYIRGEALERVARERKRYISFVQGLYDAAGVKRDFASEWPRAFVHKMLTWHKIDEFWRDLETRRRAIPR